MPIPNLSNKTVYSHADMWLLLRDYQVMDHVRKHDPGVWNAFIREVENQTGEGFPDSWTTASLLVKIADDLGSYKEMSMLWASIEEAFDYEFNFCESSDDLHRLDEVMISVTTAK